jgi:hypothetical protein
MRRRIALLLTALMLALTMVAGPVAGGAFAARPAQDKEDCKTAERQGQDYQPPFNNYDNKYENNGGCIQSVK